MFAAEKLQAESLKAIDVRFDGPHRSAGLRGQSPVWAVHLERPQILDFNDFRDGDLPPEAPSFITRVCGFGFHILRRQFGQARRARSPQIAQALGARQRVFGCPAMNAV